MEQIFIFLGVGLVLLVILIFVIGNFLSSWLSKKLKK
jgi:hypothetical protein